MLEAYSEPWQPYIIDCFAKIVNGFKFSQNLHLDVLQGSEYSKIKSYFLYLNI